jgi:predicted nucleotidyltransferase
MSDKTILKTIKSTVKFFLPDAKVLLFGSRARGDYSKDSDFDVLVITAQNLSETKKKNFRIKIHQALVNSLELPFDILLNSETEISIKRKLPGHVVRSAMNEAIEL